MSEPKLLPCPFCGGEAEICKLDLRPVGMRYSVSCANSTDCDTYFDCRAKTPEEAAKEWNKRTNPVTPSIDWEGVGEHPQQSGIWIDMGHGMEFREIIVGGFTCPVCRVHDETKCKWTPFPWPRRADLHLWLAPPKHTINEQEKGVFDIGRIE